MTELPSPEVFRCASDREIADKLLAERAVQDVLSRRSEHQSLGTRRSLLATALRLTRAVAPDTFSLLDRCMTVLDVQDDVELFVFSSPQYNAACTRPENGRVFILLSSALYEAFDEAELTFVIGHELGHHIFAHHDLPLELLHQKQEPVPARLALMFLMWQRYAEISADRAGLVCAGNFQAAATSLFKLSSGLSKAPNQERIAAYVAQAAELYTEVKQAEQPIHHRDWLASHPFSPVRLSAAKAFFDSKLMGSTHTTEQLEEQVHGFMAMMEPAYVDEDSDEAEAMRRLVFTAGVAVAAADGEVSGKELASLGQMVGERRLPAELHPEKIIATLPKRIARAVDIVRLVRRAQAVRDLATIARADGHTSDAETAVLWDVAKQLGVDPMVVEDALAQNQGLD